MIDVYSWPTPNGHKVHIMLEECGLPWRVHAVNIGKGDQFEADFLAISPNNKIPAIVDPDGPDGAPISVFESGAIGVGVDPLPWTCIGLILKPFRVLSGHARRHLQQHQTALRCSFQSSGVRGSPDRCAGAGGCTSLQSR